MQGTQAAAVLTEEQNRMRAPALPSGSLLASVPPRGWRRWEGWEAPRLLVVAVRAARAHPWEVAACRRRRQVLAQAPLTPPYVLPHSLPLLMARVLLMAHSHSAKRQTMQDPQAWATWAVQRSSTRAEDRSAVRGSEGASQVRQPRQPIRPVQQALVLARPWEARAPREVWPREEEVRLT